MLPSQQIQEEEYFMPYHWSFKPETFIGRIYFGYMDICLSFLERQNKSLKVLDAGCGDGRFLEALRERGVGEVYGIDYSVRATSFAKIMVPEASVSVGSITDLPYEDNFFDAVFLIEVLEHIPPAEINNLLNSLKRVLKPGGELILTTPSTNWPTSDKHFQHFSKGSLTKILKPYFEIIDMQGQNVIGFSLLNFLYKFLDNRYWLLRKLAQFYNLNIWPKYLNHSPLTHCQRIIVRMKK